MASRAPHTAKPVHYKLKPVQTLRASALFPFLISIASRIDSVSEHTHDFCEIIYVYHGSGMHDIEGKRYPVTGGQLLVLPLGVKHSFPTEEKRWHKHAVVAYKPELFNGWKTEIDPHRFMSSVIRSKQYLYSVPMQMTSRMESCLEAMYLESTLKSPGYEKFIRLDLLKFIAYCESVITGKRTLPEQINDREPIVNFALASMERHYRRLHSVADILHPSKINRKYFTRLFKKTVGLTPIQYLNRLRIEKCLPSLAAKDSVVMQEAHAAGFRDIAHFNRLFRRFLGMSPLSFKAAVAQGSISISNYTRLSFGAKKSLSTKPPSLLS